MTDAAVIARRLADCAHAVCAHYLPNGRKQGRYWIAGDIDDTKGQSLFVRLSGTGSGKGAAGKWTDAATGQHGDLLDLIALRLRHRRLSETLDEARRFLAMPETPPSTALPKPHRSQAAPRLFNASRPLTGSPAELYLRRRGITFQAPPPWLRFHPTCYYRDNDTAPLEHWPALIAGVTDLSGTLTGIQRTWLTRNGLSKAPIANPRRALGHLLGNGVRLQPSDHMLVVAEGLETALSLRAAIPTLPLLAALSASHLAAITLPPSVLRLYIASDNDPQGHAAARRLSHRAANASVEAFRLLSVENDWNDDLLRFGLAAVRAAILAQLTPADAARFECSDLISSEHA